MSEDGGENAGKWRHAWSGAAGPARVDGLAPARRYCVRVGAANAVGEGPWSAVASASTLRLPPAAPLNISVKPCSGCDSRIELGCQGAVVQVHQSFGLEPRACEAKKQGCRSLWTGFKHAETHIL